MEKSRNLTKSFLMLTWLHKTITWISVFTECDTWPHELPPTKVHSWILSVTFPKPFIFEGKYAGMPQNYGTVTLSRSSLPPVTHHETPGVFISESIVTHDWTCSQNDTVCCSSKCGWKMTTLTMKHFPGSGINLLMEKSTTMSPLRFSLHILKTGRNLAIFVHHEKWFQIRLRVSIRAAMFLQLLLNLNRGFSTLILHNLSLPQSLLIYLCPMASCHLHHHHLWNLQMRCIFSYLSLICKK